MANHVRHPPLSSTRVQQSLSMCVRLTTTRVVAQAVAIFAHNFPEGLATFVGTLAGARPHNMDCHPI